MQITVTDTGNVARLIDEEAMRHIALFGCVKGMDPFALHMLKKSQDPTLRFRRYWMRQTAIRQHIEAERNQKRIIEKRKHQGLQKLDTMRNDAEIDSQWFNEMRHYNKEPISQYQNKVRQELPRVFSGT